MAGVCAGVAAACSASALAQSSSAGAASAAARFSCSVASTSADISVPGERGAAFCVSSRTSLSCFDLAIVMSSGEFAVAAGQDLLDAQCIAAVQRSIAAFGNRYAAHARSDGRLEFERNDIALPQGQRPLRSIVSLT